MTTTDTQMTPKEFQQFLEENTILYETEAERWRRNAKPNAEILCNGMVLAFKEASKQFKKVSNYINPFENNYDHTEELNDIAVYIAMATRSLVEEDAKTFVKLVLKAKLNEKEAYSDNLFSEKELYDVLRKYDSRF